MPYSADRERRVWADGGSERDEGVGREVALGEMSNLTKNILLIFC